MKHVILFICVFISSRILHAEIYMTNEKCQIKDSRFSLNTRLNSVIENGISEHKYFSVLKIKDQKSVHLKPQSEIDETPMSLGSSYTLVPKNKHDKKKISFVVKKAVERSSFASGNGGACGPVLSVKEYDVRVRGIAARPVMAKMICDNRSVFVSSKCDDSPVKTARR